MSEKRYLSYITSPKVIASLLVILSLTSVYYGWNSWTKSFKFSLIANESNKKSLQTAQSNLLNETQGTDTKVDFSDPKLKLKDTDGDGLNDWDELNNYKTSPYIADSDSDKINDGDEVKRGSDPLCAEGNNCLAAEPLPTTAASKDLGVSEIPTSTVDLQQLNQISSSDLRRLLSQAGYTDEQLKQLSDEQLEQLWQQALQELSAKKQ